MAQIEMLMSQMRLLKSVKRFILLLLMTVMMRLIIPVFMTKELKELVFKTNARQQLNWITRPNTLLVLLSI